MSRKKVLQISHDYENPFPSVCAKYAQLFDPERYAVTTVYLRGNPSEEVSRKTGGKEVLYFQLPEGSLRGLKSKALYKLYRLCRQEKFGCVIAHRYKPIYLAGIISYFVPTPLILGVAHEHQVFARTTRHLFLTRWCRNIKVLAVSDSVREDILDTCPSLRTANRVFTLHNSLDSVNLEKQLLSRTEARRALGLDRDKFVFGTVGRLVRRKDHDTLLRAFARLTDDESILVLIGSGRRESHLRSLAEDLQIKARVLFLGHVADAVKYLRALDVFVLPSKREPFGMVLLEAMLARVPVITSDTKGPREVLGEAACSFAVGDVDDLVVKMDQARRQTATQREQQTELAYLHLNENFSVEVFRQKFWKMDFLQSIS